MTHKILMFMKFGQAEHIKDLYYNGTIYMNSIQYFRTLEDNKLRGDIYEGVSKIVNYPPDGEFEIPELNYKGKYLTLQIRESPETVLGNIFSLYCISSNSWKNPNDFKIDKKVKEFGSYCILIKDCRRFLDLFEAKLLELKLRYRHNFIKYYEKDNIDRDITHFEKPLDFEYQKEFRIYVQQDSTSPLIINIGSMTEYAELHDSSLIIDNLRLIENNTNRNSIK